MDREPDHTAETKQAMAEASPKPKWTKPEFELLNVTLETRSGSGNGLEAGYNS